MMLNTQLMLVIFDGFSVVVRVIDADDGGSISMASKDHGCYFVGVVTPFVRTPITLLPILSCGSCKPPDHALANTYGGTLSQLRMGQ